MKKYLLLSAIFCFALTNCTNEGMELNTYGGKGLSFVHFVGDKLDISTALDEPAEHNVRTITISSTEKSDVERSYTLTIDPSSTAIEGTHYTLSSKTITIPAGAYASNAITITVVVDNLIKDVLTAILVMDDKDFIDYGSVMTVSMNRYDLCEFEESMLVGTFNYVSPPSEWYESGVLTLTADPGDPYKIYIQGIPSEGLTWNGTPIVLNVQPYAPGLTDLSLSGPKAVVADDLGEWGYPYYTNFAFEAVSGSFNVCSGAYTIYFEITDDDPIPWGTYLFTFSK